MVSREQGCSRKGAQKCRLLAGGICAKLLRLAVKQTVLLCKLAYCAAQLPIAMLEGVKPTVAENSHIAECAVGMLYQALLHTNSKADCVALQTSIL